MSNRRNTNRGDVVGAFAAAALIAGTLVVVFEAGIQMTHPGNSSDATDKRRSDRLKGELPLVLIGAGAAAALVYRQDYTL